MKAIVPFTLGIESVLPLSALKAIALLTTVLPLSALKAIALLTTGREWNGTGTVQLAGFVLLLLLLLLLLVFLSFLPSRLDKKNERTNKAVSF